MRKLFNEFFYIPKHGKVSEKVMMSRLVSTITVVVICLAAMSITAYAYFSYNVTSGSNIIQAATFETKVQVQITDSNDKAVEARTSNYRSYVAEIKANTEYFVTIERTERSTAETGFVIVTAKDCDSRFHTQQLNKGGTAITFKIEADADTEVYFDAHWGTSKYYGYPDENSEFYILEGELANFAIKGAVKEQGGDETTTPPTTDSTTPPAKETTPPTTETTTPSTTVTEPETTGTGETTTTPEPETTGTPASTEQTEPQATTETQPAEETTGTTPNEASE